jgi:hypothetical protein
MAIGDSARFGYEASLGIAEETTFGTKVDSFAYVEFNSESLKLNREELKLESINTSRDYIKRMLGQDSVEGSIELFFNPAEDACVRLMKQAMGGTVSSSTLTAGAIAHTLNAGDMENNQSTSGAADVKSLSIQLSIGDTSTNSIGWDYLGCRINSLSLKGEIGSPVVMTTEIIGKAASTTASTPTVSFSDIKPVNFTGITLQTGDSITNVSAETFIGFELTINNNLIGDTNARGLGSRTVNVLPPSRREVMLKLTQRFDTLTSYNRAIQGTMTAIKIILDSEQTITAGGSTYSTAINLPACYFNSNQPEFSDFGILTHEVEVSAIKENTTSSYSVQIQINNATNNY